MSLTGSGPDDPQKVGVPISDLLAGMYGAYGVLAALLERERTGDGTVVRTSLLAATVGVHAFQGTRWTVAGKVGRAQGNHHASIAPYGLFHCADGTVQIAVGSEGLWRRFCAGFGLDPDTAGLATNSERVDHLEDTIAFVEAAFASWPAADLLAELAEVGVPAGKVRSLDEVYAWDQVASQGLRTTVEHATLGEVTLPGPPLRFFDRDGDEVTRTDHRPPPPARRARRQRAGVARPLTRTGPQTRMVCTFARFLARRRSIVSASVFSVAQPSVTARILLRSSSRSARAERMAASERSSTMRSVIAAVTVRSDRPKIPSALTARSRAP